MEEKLINSMKNMFKSIKKEEDSDKYLFFSAKYSPVVKISDWFLPQEAEPKDNNPYHPPGGNYFLSTYLRLGAEAPTDNHWESTTQAMLRQICSLKDSGYLQRPIVPPDSDILLLKETPLICRGFLCRDVPFLTTYDKDFRHPFPYNGTPKKVEEKRAEKKFGLRSNFTSPKICETKFLDDEVNYIKPIEILKEIPPYQTQDTTEC